MRAAGSEAAGRQKEAHRLIVTLPRGPAVAGPTAHAGMGPLANPAGRHPVGSTPAHLGCNLLPSVHRLVDGAAVARRGEAANGHSCGRAGGRQPSVPGIKSLKLGCRPQPSRPPRRGGAAHLAPLPSSRRLPLAHVISTMSAGGMIQGVSSGGRLEGSASSCESPSAEPLCDCC